jgi:hypothetical protein
MDHLEKPSDLAIGVSHDREAQSGVLSVVDVLDPPAVLFDRVGAEADGLDTTGREFVGQLRGATHFGGASGCEIGRVNRPEFTGEGLVR